MTNHLMLCPSEEAFLVTGIKYSDFRENTFCALKSSELGGHWTEATRRFPRPTIPPNSQHPYPRYKDELQIAS